MQSYRIEWECANKEIITWKFSPKDVCCQILLLYLLYYSVFCFALFAPLSKTKNLVMQTLNQSCSDTYKEC